MAEVKKLLQRGVSISVSALLVLFLWPIMPAPGSYALAEEETLVSEETVSAEADTEGADASQVPSESTPDPVPDPEPTLEEKLAVDVDVFEAIVDALSNKAYVYDTKTQLEPADLDPAATEFPELALSYTFQISDDDTNPLAGVVINDPADIFSVALTPQDVSASSADPWQVTITVTCDEDPAQQIDPPLEFTITAVQQKPVTLPALDSLPYRLDQASQDTPAKQAVEKAVKGSGIKEADLPSEVLASFSLTSYPVDAAAGASFQAGIAFDLDQELISKYQLVDAPAQITVDAVVEIPASQASGFKVGNGAEWITSSADAGIAATYAGHSLSRELATGYDASVGLNTAEGSYTGIALYAQDDTGVITKVTNIAYKVDRTAPVVRTFSVDEPTRKDGSFWFFNNKATVTVMASDTASDDASASVGAAETPAAQVSGISSDSYLDYVDGRSGQAQAKGVTSLTGNNAETAVFEFDVDGDQDVTVSSFKAHITDNAGNRADESMAGAKDIPASIVHLVADSGNPQLSVSFNNNDARNGRYYNAGRVGTFTVTEPNFAYLQQYDGDQIIVTIVEEGQTHVYRAKDFQSIGGDRWQVSYDFFSDADYSVQARVTDLAGKSSESFAADFTVDRTAPGITVTFDNESAAMGSYYNAARTATISVTEHNFSSDLISVTPTSNAGNGTEMTAASASGWSDNGDTHICTVSFPGQGVYGLTVTATDAALNALPEYTAPEFTVDTVAPQISITVNGDADASGRAYKDGCGVSVIIDDTNADPTSTVTITPIGLNSVANPYMSTPSLSDTQITYACADPARNPENDNVYRVEVNAMDMAGNTETKVVDWSVNRFGSTYVLNDETQEMVNRRYIKSEDTHDVHITEINPSGLNEDDVLVSLASGAKNNTLQKDTHYSFVPSENSGWPAYEYVINKDNFASDGTYQVMLHSTDVAGNASMNTMDNKSADRANTAEVVFSVDNTAPIVTFNGFNEAAVSANSHEVGFSIEDNTKLDRAVVRVNGEKVKTLDTEALEDPSNLKLTLAESGDNQLVTVEAYDMANNMEPQDSPSIFVNSNPLLRLLHNPLVLIGIIAGIAVIAVAVIFLLVPFLKRRRVA